MNGVWKAAHKNTHTHVPTMICGSLTYETGKQRQTKRDLTEYTNNRLSTTGMRSDHFPVLFLTFRTAVWQTGAQSISVFYSLTDLQTFMMQVSCPQS